MYKNIKGFTLVEIAVVLLIVSILLGYTVAMVPRQQELKQFKKAKQEMEQIQNSLYAFAQVNGYLPCPALIGSNGFECRDIDTVAGNCDDIPPVTNTNTCDVWFGAVPAKTLGLNGKYSNNGLLLDPWGEQYYYAVSNVDNGLNLGSDFVIQGEMRLEQIGNLAPDLAVCNADTTLSGTACDNANERILENAPAVIISRGKNKEVTVLQTENNGTDSVYISAPFSDNYDDLVIWLSPNVLYSKMIEANQLP